MRLPLAWLRDYVDLPADANAAAIAARLAMLGFPVESIERRPVLQNVVVGRIERVERHPNADRLQVCTVDVGADEPLVIATAATNVATGQTIPVAPPGSVLAGPEGSELRIERRTMRGLESQGMLCSSYELGLPAEWFEDGIMQLESDVEPGTDVLAHYRLTEPVLEVEITSNRVDAMSVLGLARELAASYGVPLREPATQLPSNAQAGPSDLRVTLESRDALRFVGQHVSGVESGTSPAAMRVRLALAGQRPIDSVVDVSNFVMLETGQPLHFYDYDRIAGHHLIARDARAGETLRTLDGEDRTLDSSALVIADDRSVLGLAGLRGGASSEVSPQTSELVIESATFFGPRVRRMGVALGLRTDASARHEKTLPFGLNDLGAARAAYLLAQTGATVHPAVIAGKAVEASAPIAVSQGLVARTLGFRPTVVEIENALRGLGFRVETNAGTGTDDATFAVTPPAWRGDIEIPVDVVEEAARLIGYDRIAAVEPPAEPQRISSAQYDTERRIAHTLVALSYREAISFSLEPRKVYDRFVAAGMPASFATGEIGNPLSEDQRYLRFSLLPGLLELAARYETRAPLRYFEIGNIFWPQEGDPPVHEIPKVAWILVTPPDAGPEWRDAGFLTFKGESEAFVRALTGRVPETVTTTTPVLHPGKTASLCVNGRDVATIGAVHPRMLAAFEIERPVYAGMLTIANLPQHQVPLFQTPSRFPGVERDFALIVAPDVPAREIEDTIRASVPQVVRNAHVFDEYRGPQVGEGKKSIAVRVLLQRDDATLTDPDVEDYVATILAALRDKLAAEIR